MIFGKQISIVGLTLTWKWCYSSNAFSADSRVAFAEFKFPANENWYAWVKFDCTFSNPNCSLILIPIISPCFFRSFYISSLAWVIRLFICSDFWPAAAWLIWYRLTIHSHLRILPEIHQQVHQKYGENKASIFCYSINESRVEKFLYKGFYYRLDRLSYSYFLADIWESVKCLPTCIRSNQN